MTFVDKVNLIGGICVSIAAIAAVLAVPLGVMWKYLLKDALIRALTTIIKSVVEPMFAESARRQTEIATNQAKSNDKIDKIYANMPNGGSSLKQELAEIKSDLKITKKDSKDALDRADEALRLLKQRGNP